LEAARKREAIWRQAALQVSYNCLVAISGMQKWTHYGKCRCYRAITQLQLGEITSALGRALTESPTQLPAPREKLIIICPKKRPEAPWLVAAAEV
jgi:hypothetical protein